MPEGLGREGGLQEIRNCIRRLRVEKKVNTSILYFLRFVIFHFLKVHTLVLLCIFSTRVVLINHHGLKLAEFPAESIRFCDIYKNSIFPKLYIRFCGVYKNSYKNTSGFVVFMPTTGVSLAW